MKISDTEEWEEMFCKIVSSYYGASRSYYGADQRFAVAIKPYLHLFNGNSLMFLLQKIEPNAQTWGRGRSYTDNPKIKERIEDIIGADFDSSQYPKFWEHVEDS